MHLLKKEKIYCAEGSRVCPLFLLVKVVWRQGRLLECKVGKVTRIGISEYGAAK
jgi:hypothetical protein